MRDSEIEEFIEVMKACFAYYRTALSEAVLMIYINGLMQYDLAAIKEALGRHVKNPDSGQFPPKIADLEKMLSGSTSDAALVAWAKLEKAVKSLGAYYTVVFDDPLIHRVVDEMGGWIVLSQTTVRDWPFKQNEFVNRYRAYKVRGTLPEYPPKLVGIVDGENRMRGFPPDDSHTRLVGDRDAAQRVLENGSGRPMLGIAPLARALPSPATDARGGLKGNSD